MATLRCPHCSKEAQVPDPVVPGQDVRCQSCRKLYKAPAGVPALQPAATPALQPAGAPARPAGGSGQGNAARPQPQGASAQATAPRPTSPSSQGTAPRPAAAAVAAPPPPGPPAPAANSNKATSLQGSYRRLLEAVSFAARAHKHQMRKDEKTPYVSHVFRVLLIVRHVFGVDDPLALTAAVLHDTIEDTTTDWDDVEKLFGGDVAGFVASLSKDKRRPEPKREEIYKSAFSKGSWQVQVCKLADIFDNLMDSVHTPPDQRLKTIQRSREYLTTLAPALQEQSRRPYEVVSQLLTEIEGVKS